jgi:DNA polymerase III delta prime subunit
MLKHHAYLCRVSIVKPESIESFVASLEISEVNYIILENFGIGDVRSLTEKAFVRPQIGSVQLIVVCIKAITIEAQQALLKLLEEPPTSTAFIFCVPQTLYLLPTLLSRFQLTAINTNRVDEIVSPAFVNFSILTVPERLNEITARLAAEDTKWVEEIKDGLLKQLVKHSSNFPSESVALLFWLAEHLQTRGASNKLLLEELALTLKPAAEKS